MSDIREPMQKRSIETKQRIADAGFQLFCEKGYYKTNTIEIAARAEVSVGALYSYYADKRDIYIEAFEQYLRALSISLLKMLREAPECFELSAFIENWISFYVDLYANSGRALMQLKIMILDDAEINAHFSNLETEYFLGIAVLLSEKGITCDNIFEKVYASCILIDSLRQEKFAFQHTGLSFDILKSQIVKAILTIFSA